MFKYLMLTGCGKQIAATFQNPVSKGDEIYYGAKGESIERYLVFEVKHQVDGGSTIVCDKM